VRRASRSQISQRSRKDRPHHGVDIVRIELWPPPAVPSGIAVRLGAPRASVRWWRRQAGSIAWRPRAWPGLVVGRFTQAEPCRAGGYLVRLWGGDGWGFAPSVGKDHPEAPERQLVSGISWMPARFRRTSSRSASGDAPATAPASRGPFVKAGMRKQRERAGFKRRAWPVPASSVEVDACPCQRGYTVSVSCAARAAREMWVCRARMANEEVGAHAGSSRGPALRARQYRGPSGAGGRDR
jgi:hypothetical protein